MAQHAVKDIRLHWSCGGAKHKQIRLVINSITHCTILYVESWSMCLHEHKTYRIHYLQNPSLKQSQGIFKKWFY
jgi:hypothetical protein